MWLWLLRRAIPPFCRKPTSAYLAKASNGHHTAGVAASLLLSITTNGTGFGGVQYILASASGYNISSFAVFLSARTSGRHWLLSVVVLLVIYSRRWRSLGAGLDPRLVYVSFFVSSFLCNNPFHSDEKTPSNLIENRSFC